MPNNDVAGSLTGWLEQRQRLRAAHADALQRARDSRRSTVFSRLATSRYTARPTPELPAASQAAQMHLDDARRYRVLFAAARPGRSIPQELGMSGKQLEEHRARTARTRRRVPPTRGL